MRLQKHLSDNSSEGGVEDFWNCETGIVKLVLGISKASRDRAERVSYGEWQEPVLAIFKTW